jgi:hypothetical protein
MFCIVTYKHFRYLRNTLFRNGKFDKPIRLLHMHAANEGNGFASPAITNESTIQLSNNSFSNPSVAWAICYNRVIPIGLRWFPSPGLQEPVRARRGFLDRSLGHIGEALPFNTRSSDYVITPALQYY